MSNEDCINDLSRYNGYMCLNAGQLYTLEEQTIITAIQSIKKQIPKKPSNYKGYEGKCKCGVVFLDKSTKYCGNCGQALDWGENNKD